MNNWTKWKKKERSRIHFLHHPHLERKKNPIQADILTYAICYSYCLTLRTLKRETREKKSEIRSAVKKKYYFFRSPTFLFDTFFFMVVCNSVVFFWRGGKKNASMLMLEANSRISLLSLVRLAFWTQIFIFFSFMTHPMSMSILLRLMRRRRRRRLQRHHIELSLAHATVKDQLIINFCEIKRIA